MGLFGFFSGCSGKSITPSKQVELEIPKDLAKAFEVKEDHTPPSPADATKATKKESKKKEVKVTPTSSKKVLVIRRPNFDPLWVNEKIWMDVTWLNTTAGEFLLEVLPFKSINDRKVYDIRGTARTTDIFKLIYKAEDVVESFVDFEGWFPYKFSLNAVESRYTRSHLELYDHMAKKQYIHIQDLRLEKNELSEKQGYFDLETYSQDSLSAIYYTRTQKLEAGTVLRFPMTTQGKQWETTVTVLGPEEIKTKMGYMRAIKTKIETRFQGVLQQQGDAFMWFSDDVRKFPIRFEAKVKIGWVAGIVKKIEPGDAPTGASMVDDKNASSVSSEVEEKQSRASGKKKKKRLWFKNLIDQDEASAIQKQAPSKPKTESNNFFQWLPTAD